MDKPYYFAYENRYKKAFTAGVDRWGHSPDDEILLSTLSNWVKVNHLQGKKIIEFGCGEGACGEILSKLGCIYHGIDISPAVIEKTSITLKHYSNTSVETFDMVNDVIKDKYDGALDVMALHMLILDNDRQKYLKNAYNCLNKNSPMLFFRELHNENEINEDIISLEQWITITGNDYTTPKIKQIVQNNRKIELNLPYVPGREKSKNGYIKELTNVGFKIEKIIEMESSKAVQNSVSIFVKKTE